MTYPHTEADLERELFGEVPPVARTEGPVWRYRLKSLPVGDLIVIAPGDDKDEVRRILGMKFGTDNIESLEALHG
jgi:hypothetical protein